MSTAAFPLIHPTAAATAGGSSGNFVASSSSNLLPQTPGGDSPSHPTPIPPPSINSQQPTAIGSNSIQDPSFSAPDVSLSLYSSCTPKGAQVATPLKRRDSSTPPLPPAQEPQRFPGSINIFVAGLTQTIGDKDFEKMFSRFGPVLSAKVMLDVNTGTSRGYGFLLFRHEEDGLRAKKEMDGTSLGPNTLHVSVSEHDGYVTECKSVCVRNIPSQVTEQEVIKVFTENCGPIVRVALRKDSSTGSSGSNRLNLATIEFTTIEASRSAVKFAHGNRPFEQCSVSLLAKFAESAESRESRRRRRLQRDHPSSAGGTGFNLPPPPSYQSIVSVPSLAAISVSPTVQQKQQQQQMFCLVPTAAAASNTMPTFLTPPAFPLQNSLSPGSGFITGGTTVSAPHTYLILQASPMQQEQQQQQQQQQQSPLLFGFAPQQPPSSSLHAQPPHHLLQRFPAERRVSW